MEYDIYLRDFLSSCVIASGKQLDNYYLTYQKNNEDLVSLYKEYDFKYSDVLTVLSSGDQFFTVNLLGASNVDTFDMNRLAIYYYYLRKWSIKYNNKLIPNVCNYKEMFNLLNQVKPESEEEAKAVEFYKKNLMRKTDLYNLFYDPTSQPKGKELYSSADELKPIIDKDINFRQIDMFKQEDFDKSYDYIIMSNILEWSRGDIKKLEIAKENIINATKKGSKVICSRLLNSPETKVKAEYDVFKDSFDILEYPKSKNYVYIRK